MTNGKHRAGVLVSEPDRNRDWHYSFNPDNRHQAFGFVESVVTRDFAESFSMDMVHGSLHIHLRDNISDPDLLSLGSLHMLYYLEKLKKTEGL